MNPEELIKQNELNVKVKNVCGYYLLFFFGIIITAMFTGGITKDG